MDATEAWSCFCMHHWLLSPDPRITNTSPGQIVKRRQHSTVLHSITVQVTQQAAPCTAGLSRAMPAAQAQSAAHRQTPSQRRLRMALCAATRQAQQRTGAVRCCPLRKGPNAALGVWPECLLRLYARRRPPAAAACAWAARVPPQQPVLCASHPAVWPCWDAPTKSLPQPAALRRAPAGPCAACVRRRGAARRGRGSGPHQAMLGRAQRQVLQGLPDAAPALQAHTRSAAGGTGRRYMG